MGFSLQCSLVSLGLTHSPGECDGDVLALEGVHLCAGVVVDLAPVVLAQDHQRVVGARLRQEEKIR
jgi:hypothetical protein